MIIGIDLGTTNSLVSVFREGRPEIIPNSLGDTLTPSVVGLDDDGQVLIGRAARERLVTHPRLTAAAFKRYMGTSRELRLGDRMLRAEELSALVLKSLRADAEAFLGEPVAEAIITVPAYFSDAQRKATRIAGELADLRVERLLNEPTAAALAYGLHERGSDRTFFVLDLGGGTFDVSLLELFDGVMEVRSSAGNNFLGGEDFVRRIMDGFIHHHEKPELLDDQDLRGLLYASATRAMHRLTSEPTATVTLPYQGVRLSYEIDEESFAQLAQPVLDKLRAPMERALRDANVRASELDDVVMVGGASRIRCVRALAARLLRRIPSSHVDPDRIIAFGAAVQAGLKCRDAALDDVVMTDVSPFTLGVEVSQEFRKGEFRDGYYLPIIERNSTVPISRVERLCTLHDQQSTLNLKIFQGESRRTVDNIPLGQIQVTVPLRPAGEESVDIRYTYDINGLLEVEVTVLSTQMTERLVIEGHPGVLTKEEIDARFEALAELKIHPQDKAENRALMARAQRLYEEHLGEVREAVGQYIDEFIRVLERQEPDGLDDFRARLAAVLDQIESDPYLA